MAKFRIMVEPIDGGAFEDAEFADGVKCMECDGFAIIADSGEHAEVAVHHLSVQDLAMDFAHSPKLLAAAHIGKALKEAEKMQRDSAMDGIADLLGKLHG